MLDPGRPRSPLLAALALVALLGAACTSNDDGDVAPTPAADTTGTPAPSPTEQTATPQPSPTPTAEPEGRSIAPGGRTSDPAIDALIEALLTADAAALEGRFSGTEAQHYDNETRQYQISLVAAWAARLAASERTLYAVTEAHPQQSPSADVDIAFAVSENGGEATGWHFRFVLPDRLVDLAIGIEPPRSAVASVTGSYDRFLVLPPLEDLPKPPPGHPLSVRSGDAGVDALIALVEGGDADGLLAAVEYARTLCGADAMPACGSEPPGTEVAALPLRSPRQAPQVREAEYVEGLVRDFLGYQTTLHAVAAVPEGFEPAADHLLILVTESAPFDWESWGLFERDGQVVGVHAPAGAPRGLYPPVAVLVAPPDDVTPVDPARRSGDALIDAVLDALEAGDAAALDALVDYQQLGCVLTATGIGHPLICTADEPEGTAVDVLLFAQCEGGYSRASRTFAQLHQLAGDNWALFAAVDLGGEPERPGAIRGSRQAVLLAIAGDGGSAARQPSLAMTFSHSGIASVVFPCGPEDPEATIWPGRAPLFLLAPPAPSP